jgi:hypothetical protein
MKPLIQTQLEGFLYVIGVLIMSAKAIQWAFTQYVMQADSKFIRRPNFTVESTVVFKCFSTGTRSISHITDHVLAMNTAI